MTKARQLTITEVGKVLQQAGFHYDSLSKSNGVFTYRRGFYYTQGNSAMKIAEKMTEKLPSIRILSAEDIWKRFVGGVSVKNQSNFCIKFTIDEKFTGDNFELTLVPKS
jgi:hypothetical protein